MFRHIGTVGLEGLGSLVVGPCRLRCFGFEVSGFEFSV